MSSLLTSFLTFENNPPKVVSCLVNWPISPADHASLGLTQADNNPLVKPVFFPSVRQMESHISHLWMREKMTKFTANRISLHSFKELSDAHLEEEGE